MKQLKNINISKERSMLLQYLYVQSTWCPCDRPMYEYWHLVTDMWLIITLTGVLGTRTTPSTCFVRYKQIQVLLLYQVSGTRYFTTACSNCCCCALRGSHTLSTRFMLSSASSSNPRQTSPFLSSTVTMPPSASCRRMMGMPMPALPVTDTARTRVKSFPDSSNRPSQDRQGNKTSRQTDNTQAGRHTSNSRQQDKVRLGRGKSAKNTPRARGGFYEVGRKSASN